MDALRCSPESFPRPIRPSQREHRLRPSNNLGFTRVTGEAVLLLNPDTEIRPDALQTLLGELERRPDAGIVSPRLLNPDLTLQASVHALPRPVRQAFDSEILRRLAFAVRAVGTAELTLHLPRPWRSRRSRALAC